MPTELLNALKEHCKDEREDVLEYEKLADLAFEHGMPEVSGMLMDIASDERTHVEVIRHILKTEFTD